MDDFELFRARSMHGGVLGTEQSSVEQLGHSCLDQHRAQRCKLATKFNASEELGHCRNLVMEDKANKCCSRTSKFCTRRDDVIAMPEIVRCSNAWVDFSATELPVRKLDRGQKSDRWHRPRNAWIMPRSKSSVVGFGVPDQTVTQEFDVYRLRSFATAAGRIVNRGDYFRVRQRIHPTDSELLEHLRGPSRTVTRNSTEDSTSPSNSATYPPLSTIEYRPKVYYATNYHDAPDDEETVIDDIDEDFSDEKTKLLADSGQQSGYFSRIRNRSRSSVEEKGFRPRGRDDNEDIAQEVPSTDVPDSDAEQFRVTSAIRVVVLGDRGVGKTTLARQFLTSEHLANRSNCFNFTQGKLTSVSTYAWPTNYWKR